VSLVDSSGEETEEAEGGGGKGGAAAKLRGGAAASRTRGRPRGVTFASGAPDASKNDVIEEVMETVSTSEEDVKDGGGGKDGSGGSGSGAAAGASPPHGAARARGAPSSLALSLPAPEEVDFSAAAASGGELGVAELLARTLGAALADPSPPPLRLLAAAARALPPIAIDDMHPPLSAAN
jgi:hypothetical protein